MLSKLSSGEKVGFLIEGEEAGIFEIKNVEDSQRKLLKGITCPNIVYPYLRANIADAYKEQVFHQSILPRLTGSFFIRKN